VKACFVKSFRMNFAFLVSLAWLFTTPEKNMEAGLFPKEKLVNGGIYIFQNEADSSVSLNLI